MPHLDDDPMTWGDWRNQKKKLLRQIALAVEEAGEAMSVAQGKADEQAGFWNEHEDRINRLSRQVKRIVRRLNDDVS